MSKLNIGVGEDFPVDGAEKQEAHPCEAYWRARRMHMHARWRRRRHAGPFAALLILPAATASVTAAVLYPLATLSVLTGLGLAGAAYRHTRGKPEADKPKDAT
jgi:hypothetical protein